MLILCDKVTLNNNLFFRTAAPIEAEEIFFGEYFFLWQQLQG